MRGSHKKNKKQNDKTNIDFNQNQRIHMKNDFVSNLTRIFCDNTIDNHI